MCVYWQWSHPFDHTAKRLSPAGLDSVHQTMLMQGQRVSLPVGGAVLSKDVGQLQGWRGHQRLARLPVVGWLGSGLEQQMQRTLGGADGGRRDRGIAGGGVDAAVAQ